MVDASVEVRMEALRRRLVKAVKIDGIVTYKELSEALRQNPTFVQQFVTKRSPKRLYDEQVGTITAILDAKESGRQPTNAVAEGDAENQLRSALLAFGVDGKLLSRAVAVIRSGFLRTDAEQSGQTAPDDLSVPSNPHRAEAP